MQAGQKHSDGRERPHFSILRPEMGPVGRSLPSVGDNRADCLCPAAERREKEKRKC